MSHGTRTEYNQRGCRCEPCKHAATVYRRQRTIAQINGRELMVDAKASREHIKAARAAGLPIEQVAAAAGISREHARRICNGHIQKVIASTERKILTAPFPAVDGRSVVHIPARGTVRRLQALAFLGWSNSAIAARVGADSKWIGVIRSGTSYVHAGLAQRVADAYRDMVFNPPRPRTRAERGAVTNVRNIARRNNWASPFAWDDIDTDIAPADTDEYRPATRPQQALELSQMGLGELQIAARLGIKPFTVREYLNRRAAA